MMKDEYILRMVRSGTLRSGFNAEGVAMYSAARNRLEKHEAVESAKQLLSYLETSGSECYCLIDDLTDFIADNR